MDDWRLHHLSTGELMTANKCVEGRSAMPLYAKSDPVYVVSANKTTSQDWSRSWRPGWATRRWWVELGHKFPLVEMDEQGPTIFTGSQWSSGRMSRAHTSRRVGTWPSWIARGRC